MEKQELILDAIAKYLLTLNTAAPIIFGAVTMIASLFKGITGDGPSVKDCATIIERNLSTNDRAIREEILRLKELVSAK